MTKNRALDSQRGDRLRKFLLEILFIGYILLLRREYASRCENFCNLHRLCLTASNVFACRVIKFIGTKHDILRNRKQHACTYI